MAIQWGKSPLHRLKSFRARNWFPAEFIKFGTKVADYYQDRNEVVYGLLGDVSGTTVSLSACGINLSAGEAVLNGRHYALDAESDTDVFTTTGQIGQAIYSDGADASGFAHTSASSETAYISLILCNSAGGSAIDSTDGGSALILAVVNGSASDYADKEAHCTSAEISAALEASDGVHDGGASGAPEAQEVSWVFLGEFVLTENGAGGATAGSFVANRNNAVQNN